MSQPPNQNKYDALLNQFLKNGNSIEENEGERMKRWLEEAADSIRGQSQDHRGNVGQLNSTSNDDKVWPNDPNVLEIAMCVSLPSDSSDEESHEEKKKINKRSHESYLSDIEMPLKKRNTGDQSFLKDVLSLDMISLSPGSNNKYVNNKAVNVVDSSYSGTNVFGSITPVCALGCQNFGSIFGQTNGTAIISKPTSANNSIFSKKSNGLPKYSDSNIEMELIVLESMPAFNGNNSSCIWPIGFSHQPDFIEIVVTDEEMNTYWDTIRDFF